MNNIYVRLGNGNDIDIYELFRYILQICCIDPLTRRKEKKKKNKVIDTQASRIKEEANTKCYNCTTKNLHDRTDE